MFSNVGLAFSDVTASVPTNLISSIATSTSFSSIEQISPEAASEIQETTSSIVDSDALVQDIQESAEAYGEAINVASSKGDQKEKFVVLGGDKNKYSNRTDLEPTLGTLVYDTGMKDMLREGGNYDTDNKAPNGVDNLQIFDPTPGAQKARVLVYVDFNRKVLFGSVENRITLNDGTKMTAVFNGGSATIVDGEIVDKRLSYTMSSQTGLPLRTDGPDPSTTNNEQPYFPEKVDAFENSLLAADGERNEYLDGNTSEFGLFDQVVMQKSISHGSNGDKDVAVLARFLTEGNETPGQSLAAIEAYNGSPCTGSTNCSADEHNAFKDGIERYSFTVETKVTKFTGDLPQ